jgi:hypothetical protein
MTDGLQGAAKWASVPARLSHFWRSGLAMNKAPRDSRRLHLLKYWSRR